MVDRNLASTEDFNTIYFYRRPGEDFPQKPFYTEDLWRISFVYRPNENDLLSIKDREKVLYIFIEILFFS